MRRRGLPRSRAFWTSMMSRALDWYHPRGELFHCGCDGSEGIPANRGRPSPPSVCGRGSAFRDRQLMPMDVLCVVCLPEHGYRLSCQLPKRVELGRRNRRLVDLRSATERNGRVRFSGSVALGVDDLNCRHHGTPIHPNQLKDELERHCATKQAKATTTAAANKRAMASPSMVRDVGCRTPS